MSDYKSENLKRTLEYIINKYGIETFEHEGRLLALLSDLMPDFPQDQAMMEKLFSLGIIREIAFGVNKTNEGKRNLFNASIRRLTEIEMMDPRIAEQYLSVLTEVCGWNVNPSSFKDTQVNKTASVPVHHIVENDNVPAQKPAQTAQVNPEAKPHTPSSVSTSAVNTTIPAGVNPSVISGTTHTGENMSGTFDNVKPSPRKNISPWIAVAVFILAGLIFGGVAYMNGADKKKQEQRVYESLAINILNTDVSHNVVIESDNSQINTLDYVSAGNNVTVTAEPAIIDTEQLGTVNVIYTVRSNEEGHSDITRTYEQSFVIQDTAEPVITLNETEIALIKGDSFNPQDNIAAVTDEREGDLAYSSGSTGGAYYTLDGSVNTNKAGVYPVNVIAVDSAGNRTEASFKVRVRAEERFVAIPSGCSSKRTDYETLFRELVQYGNEYTSPYYSTKDELRAAIREFEKQKYPNIPCQVYPGVHLSDGEEDLWMFYDYNPWDG